MKTAISFLLTATTTIGAALFFSPTPVAAQQNSQQNDLRCLRTSETYSDGGYRSPYYSLVSTMGEYTLSNRLTQNDCNRAIDSRNGNLICFPTGETYRNGGYRSKYYALATVNSGRILSSTLTRNDCERELNA